MILFILLIHKTVIFEGLVNFSTEAGRSIWEKGELKLLEPFLSRDLINQITTTLHLTMCAGWEFFLFFSCYVNCCHSLVSNSCH